MTLNKTPLLALISVLSLGMMSCHHEKAEDTVVLDIFHTSDIHGNILTEDLVNGGDAIGGLSRVSSIVTSYRRSGANVLLLDGGDFLQGEPPVYYYNYVNTGAKHLAARVLNFMQYDAMTAGNHDFETGHDVLDRFSREISFPLLAANAIKDTTTMESYFKPYVILEKGSKKIAILGLTTPTLTENLSAFLISGIRFDDQIETARRLMPEILSQKPDLIVALIHSGSGNPDEEIPHRNANVAYDLGRTLPEINIILAGHDHRANLDSIIHPNGSKTYLLNPGPNGKLLSHAQVTLRSQGDSTQVLIRPELLELNNYTADPVYVQSFTPQLNEVKRFVSEPIGTLTSGIDSRSALFRPNAFIDLIQEVQLSAFPEADLSFTAPLSDDVSIPAGPVLRKDLFKLYRYENMLYLMRLTGNEVKNYLEESYGRYFYTIQGPDDPLLIIDEKRRGGPYLPLKEPIFNFDTAAGISYTVDLTKPRGERITISHLTRRDTHTPFSPDSTYLVVTNTYRGSGGGGLLTADTGAAIPKDSLTGRIVRAEYKDMRRIVADYLSDHNPYSPRIISSWSLVPTEWTSGAISRDSLSLFGKEKRTPKH